MSKMLAVFITMLPVLAFGGESEVFHCKDERGRLMWSDRPCGDDLEFIGMATIKTFDAKSNRETDSKKAEEKPKPEERYSNPEIQRRTVVTSQPSAQDDCEKKDNGPWLNPVGMDDC